MHFLKKLEKVSKNIVLILGLMFLAIFFILNLFYAATVENYAEHVVLAKTTSIEFVISIVIAIMFIVAIKKKKKINLKVNKKAIILIFLILYVIVCVKWIKFANIQPVDDAKSVNDLAIALSKGDIEAIKSDKYIEKYPHQIGMVTVFAVLYKIFNTTDYHLIQYLNIVANIFTILGMYEIIKKMKFNKIAYFILSFTFIPFILLTTYVYGDYIGLAFAVWGVYFIIKYEKEHKIIYILTSAILMLLAYITKMNYIIFTIAIAAYMFLYLLQEKEVKKIVIKSGIIVLYLIISILPFNIVKTYANKKLEYDPKQAIPTSVFIYIGMSESPREAGWYGPVANDAWLDTSSASEKYPKLIKQRVKEFLKSPIYACKFYARKTISGWSDPYFQSIWYNVGKENKDEIMARILAGRKFNYGKIYQKAILILVFGGTFYAFWKNRKKLNNEMALFLIILIGGFLFHTIWEIKSRYVMPYVIMLIPMASIGIEELINVLDKLKKEER